MIREKIISGKTHLGIELGSTRIKAVLIDDDFNPIANGTFEWENRLENGYWTYPLDLIHTGIQLCYKSLAEDVLTKYNVTLTKIGSMGISAMMHGYLAFDKEDNLLVPFRTWRNTSTGEAAHKLSALFNFNIPQRWTISHLYQAILNNEPHVADISWISTLAGYIHYRLSGNHTVGIGEASGIFPIKDGTYDSEMMAKFSEIYPDIEKILPKILSAGDNSSVLTKDGALFLDSSGSLEPGIPICPPEGDAGTGMVATNSVLPGTGNVSAGTSIFAMLVLDKPLQDFYPEIDMVTTPDGAPVAMVHCNNCCAELDAWVNIFGEFAALSGINMDKSALYELLYRNTINGNEDCGGLVAYNCLSGEPVINIEKGRPMYYRTATSTPSLANFMKAQLYSSMAALRIGMDILFDKEKVNAKLFYGHGGLFKVKGIAQQILSDALNTPVSVMETAGEGGAWGMALLAAYSMDKDKLSLSDWLSQKVFAKMNSFSVTPKEDGVKGYSRYIDNFRSGLKAQKAFKEVI